MSSDEEDFVFYGTPIGREEEFTSRKKKAVAEASGQLRTALPPWKQEVQINSNFPQFMFIESSDIELEFQINGSGRFLLRNQRSRG